MTGKSSSLSEPKVPWGTALVWMAVTVPVTEATVKEEQRTYHIQKAKQGRRKVGNNSASKLIRCKRMIGAPTC